MTQNLISAQEENQIRETSVGIVQQGYGTLRAEYHFNRQGGAIGTIQLPGALPAGAKVIEAFADVISPLTGTGAEVAVNVGTTALQAAAAVSGAPWSSTGLKDLSADPVPGTESGYLEPSETRPFNVNFVVTVADLTGGHVIVIVRYAVTVP